MIEPLSTPSLLKPTLERTLTTLSNNPTRLKRRRAEKLRREIALLDHMDTRLWRKIVLCGSLTIVAIAAGIFAIGFLAHIHLGLLPAILISLAIASILYWVSRYEFGIFWLFVAILIGVLWTIIFLDCPLSGFPDIGFPDGMNKKKSRKDQLRERVDYAMRRRQQRLEKLLDRIE